MDPWTIAGLICWLIVLFWWVDSLRARFSPKYAAKRQLKADAKAERRYQARQKHRAAEKERTRKWAEKHPDDPVAKEFAAREASSESELAPDDNDVDFLTEVRRSQKADDERQKRRADEKAAAELRAQQTLDWALENATVPEARRHLDEQLQAAIDRLDSAEHSIRHCQTMMGYMKDDNDPESIEQATRLSEAEAKKTTEAEIIRRIQKALGVKLPESSEQ